MAIFDGGEKSRLCAFEPGKELADSSRISAVEIQLDQSERPVDSWQSRLQLHVFAQSSHLGRETMSRFVS